MDACKQSIKRLATNPIDLRSSTELAQKLKDSILVSL